MGNKVLCTTLKFPNWPSLKKTLNEGGHARTSDVTLWSMSVHKQGKYRYTWENCEYTNSDWYDTKSGSLRFALLKKCERKHAQPTKVTRSGGEMIL